MSNTTIEAAFEEFTRYAFRLEGLPEYQVNDERSQLIDFLGGKPLPSPYKARAEWCLWVRESVASNKRLERVRLLPEQLTPYIRYEIEWGYIYGADAGEQIRVVLPGTALPDFGGNDFWLFDDTRAFVMNYGPTGEFLGSQQINEERTVKKLRDARSDLLKCSIELPKYLSRLRRGNDVPR